MHILATSVTDADIALIVAFILLVVVGVMRFMAQAVDGALLALAGAAIVLAWIIT